MYGADGQHRADDDYREQALANQMPAIDPASLLGALSTSVRAGCAGLRIHPLKLEFFEEGKILPRDHGPSIPGPGEVETAIAQLAALFRIRKQILNGTRPTCNVVLVDDDAGLADDVRDFS